MDGLSVYCESVVIVRVCRDGWIPVFGYCLAVRLVGVFGGEHHHAYHSPWVGWREDFNSPLAG
jgi:hypothetical protein